MTTSRYAALLLIGVAGVISNRVVAQEPGTEPDRTGADQDVIDEIHVTGYRRSLFDARENKRAAEDIRDVLAQEDIGALPSLSIAESLERLPGLAADRDRGNSSQISIRGLGPNFGLTILNGREISTAAPDRDVRFDQFPSELMRGAEVYKTPQASLIEGGISGTINLQTIKPLETDADRVFTGQVLGNFSELDADRSGSDGFGLRGSGAYIGKHLDGRLGFAAGIAFRDSDTPTNRQINGAFVDNRDFDADGTNDFAPGNIQYRYTHGTDDRIGAYATLQYDISPALRLTVDGLHTDREGIDRRSFLQFNNARAGNAGFDTGTSAVDSNNVMTAADYSNIGPVRVQMQHLTQEDVSSAFGVNLDWGLGDWSVNADGSYSRTTRDRVLYQPRSQRVPPRVNAAFRMVDDGVYELVSADALGTNDDFRLQRLQLQQQDVTDELYAGRVDVERSLDGAFFTAFGAGLRYVSRSKESLFDNDVRAFNVNNDPRPVAAYGVDFPYDDFLGGADGAFPQAWPVFDPIGVFAEVGGPFPFDRESVSDLASSYDVEEDRLAGYLMLEFGGELSGLPFFGDIGVRVVQTDVSSRGFAADVVEVIIDPGTGEVTDVIFGDPEPVRLENDFSNVLPNLNLNFELTPDLLLRFGAAQTIARAPIDTLGATRTLGFNQNIGQPTGSGGNPFLEPFEANQFDLSLEYYFAEDGLFSVAAFFKDLDTVIFPNSSEDAIETYDGVDFTVSRPVNEEANENIQGVEVQYQQTFSFLPGPLRHVGAAVNFTLIENDIEFVFNPNAQYTVGLAGVSDNVFNAALFYDDGAFSGRIAYRNRDEFFRPIGGNRLDDGSDILDLNVSYKLTDAITLVFQGLNLTDDPTVVRHVPTSPNALAPYDNLVNFTEHSGRKWFAGVRFRL